MRSVAIPGRVGLFLIGLMALLSLLGPWLTPHDPITSLDPGSSANRPPLTTLTLVVTTDGTSYLADEISQTSDGYTLDRGRFTTQLAAEAEPRIHSTRQYLLGTDQLGRDVLSRVLAGMRVSLVVGILAALLSLTLGCAVGSAAALGPRWIDRLLMRLVDGILAFPNLVLILLLVAFFRPQLGVLILLIGSTTWMTASRLVRTEILRIRSSDYVRAGRCTGLSTPRLLLRHLLPNALTPLLVETGLRVGLAILTEASLSFLGLGVQAPTPSLGAMMADGRSQLETAWWIVTFPGIVVTIAVVGFNLASDALRDAFDPQQRRSVVGRTK